MKIYLITIILAIILIIPLVSSAQSSEEIYLNILKSTKNALDAIDREM